MNKATTSKSSNKTAATNKTTVSTNAATNTTENAVTSAVKTSTNRITTATKITIARIVLLPVIMFFYLCGGTEGIFYDSSFLIQYGKLIALILFVFAAATDWLDGWVARKYNQVTDMGKLLDPIADKMLTLLGFVLIATDIDIITWVLPVWLAVLAVFIAIGRDYVINALRQLGAEKGITIAADRYGKIKSVLQYIAIVLLMFYAFDAVGSNTVIALGTALDVYEFICIFMLVAATVVSVYSAANYLIKYKEIFAKNDTAASKKKKHWPGAEPEAEAESESK